MHSIEWLKKKNSNNFLVHWLLDYDQVWDNIFISDSKIKTRMRIEDVFLKRISWIAYSLVPFSEWQNTNDDDYNISLFFGIVLIFSDSIVTDRRKMRRLQY